MVETVRSETVSAGSNRRTRDKTARMLAMAPHFENGRIRVRRDMRDFEAEYLAFPKGAHDDLLDACEKAVEAALDYAAEPSVRWI